MLHKELLERIETRFGRRLRYPEETVALSQAIFDTTHEYLSASTLKRMFGWLGGGATHRESTLDILARYLGYPCWREMKCALGEEGMAPEIKRHPFQRLQRGDEIRMSASSGMDLTLGYEGSGIFRVLAASGRLPSPGDTVAIRC